MNKDQLMGWILFGAACVCFFVAGYKFAYTTAEPKVIEVMVEPDPVEEPDPVTFNVDGVECWFGTRPVLSYRPNSQTVDAIITCGSELLDAYLPAIERTQ